MNAWDRLNLMQSSSGVLGRVDRDLGDCQISLDLLVRGMSDETSPSLIPVSNGRLMSLDAFRGFIMFWIPNFCNISWNNY